MAAKPKKSAASVKSSSSATTTTSIIPATTSTSAPYRYTNSANATHPVLSSSLPTSRLQMHYKEPSGQTLTKVMPENPDSDHRPNQPYQGAAPLRPVQQSPNLNTTQSHQPSYAVQQGVFSPQPIQSPYLNNPPQFPPHPQSTEGGYYQPSPRSTTSSYYPSDKPEPMAAATATMQRPYSNIYHTPQSNSPVSVTSPQSHDHGRPMYPQPPPQMQQPMYAYPNYQTMAPMHQSPYGGHQHQPQMAAQPMLPYQSNPNSMNQATMASQPSNIQSSPRIKNEASRQYAQTSQSQGPMMAQQRPSGSVPPPITPLQPGPPVAPPASSAAPGPIPATTPLVVHQDGNGVQWIAFEYSRDRVKMEYTIRCDVESVDATNLSQEFKGENCVYPRACVPKDQYKGNRLAYETDCNQVGWALAELNPCLRGKRGLIQRAVDSWRNSNQDPRLRSRRVRRQAKMNNRQKVGLTSQAAGPPSDAHPSSASMKVADTKPPAKMTVPSAQSHPHGPQISSPTVQDHAGVPQYSTTPGMHRSGSNTHSLTSPSDLRPAQTFPGYQAYPQTTMGSSMAPSIHGMMHNYGRQGGQHTMASRTLSEGRGDIDLYGDLPEAKRRKFISVPDAQKDAKVRVKVTLDQIDLSEIPDSYRRNNSVFPRAYFPIQMRAASQSTCGDRFVGDDVEEMDDGPPIVGRTTVPCQLSEGTGEVEVAHLSRHKRDRERKLNELGYRMAWGQSRVFANRPIFLGRALDIYRNKQSSLLAAEDQSSATPAHLRTRPGKRRWQERTRQISHGVSPASPDCA